MMHTGFCSREHCSDCVGEAVASGELTYKWETMAQTPQSRLLRGVVWTRRRRAEKGSGHCS